ncbi:hypothetical protein Hdeb2414_s0014g00421551 [Helianthus debilis subsp. tardiflorus]
MGIRVLSGVHFLEVLAYMLPLCNEDTGPVMPSSDISGCDTLRVNLFRFRRTGSTMRCRACGTRGGSQWRKRVKRIKYEKEKSITGCKVSKAYTF